MPSPIETVTAFCTAVGATPDGMREAIRRWFRPDTVWINTGLATTTGIDEALALVDAIDAKIGSHAARFEVFAIAAQGDKVLTERVDHMIGADGTSVMSAPVMGIFEIEGDRIAAWRDYFDSAAALNAGV